MTSVPSAGTHFLRNLGFRHSLVTFPKPKGEDQSSKHDFKHAQGAKRPGTGDINMALPSASGVTARAETPRSLPVPSKDPARRAPAAVIRDLLPAAPRREPAGPRARQGQLRWREHGREHREGLEQLHRLQVRAFILKNCKQLK